MSSLLYYRAPSPASFKLSQPQNVSKDDFPMALLPDPTTAASERSSVKRRLTESRAEAVQGDFAKIYFPFQCIEDVHNMRARSREVHTDL